MRKKQLEQLNPKSTLQDLPDFEFRVNLRTPGKVVVAEFERRLDLPGAMLEDDGRIIGLISRQAVFQQIGRQFGLEVFMNRPIQVLWNSIETRALRLPHTCGVADAAQYALKRSPQHYDPLLVDYPNHETRMLDIYVLLLGQTQMLKVVNRLEEQLHQASKMEAIGQLAGGVAHDFNNLLTVILGNLSLVKGRLVPEHTHVKLLEDAEKAASRAANLTNQLLGFARQKPLHVEPTQLNNCVRETVDLVRRIMDQRIEIKIDIAPDLNLVMADPNQLNQVLMNLCVNARDAMTDGGRLVIEAGNVAFRADSTGVPRPSNRTGAFVHLSVEDTGKGIAPEHLPHIFEPFFTTKGPGQGTGLGLAMVYGIVEQCGGWIECDSLVGRGTRFDIFLPRSEVKARTPAAVAPLSTRTDSKETILLVDDEELVRNISRNILQHHGYEIVLATGGPEALEILRLHEQDIDLVLLDMNMPSMSGRETLQHLRRLSADVPVLICSGYSTHELSDAERHEVLGFVSKPYCSDDLVNAVRLALEKPRQPAITGARDLVGTCA